MSQIVSFLDRAPAPVASAGERRPIDPALTKIVNEQERRSLEEKFFVW